MSPFDPMDSYGDPAASVETYATRKRNGVHVAVIRFRYEHSESYTSHQREMVRLADLNKLIDDLTELAEKAGIR